MELWNFLGQVWNCGRSGEVIEPPWMFDQHILSLVHYEREKELSLYNFSIVLFWIRISNVPTKMMDRKLVIEVGSVVGKVIAID